MFWILTKIMPGGVLAGKRTMTRKTSSCQVVESRLQSIRSRFLRPTIVPQGDTTKDNWDLQIASYMQDHA